MCSQPTANTPSPMPPPQAAAAVTLSSSLSHPPPLSSSFSLLSSSLLHPSPAPAAVASGRRAPRDLALRTPRLCPAHPARQEAQPCEQQAPAVTLRDDPQPSRDPASSPNSALPMKPPSPCAPDAPGTYLLQPRNPTPMPTAPHARLRATPARRPWSRLDALPRPRLRPTSDPSRTTPTTDAGTARPFLPS
jgi:hypothetical protein